MGGQTIRQMEEFLRNGNQEEIEYQRQHGGCLLYTSPSPRD